MAIQPSIHWVNNQTRLNAQNMNAISTSIDTLGFELYGDNNNGLVNTVSTHKGWFTGDASTPNSGVFHQLNQLGQAVLTPYFRKDTNHSWAAGDYDFSAIQSHQTPLPNTTETPSWGLDSSLVDKPEFIKLQLCDASGYKRSLLGPSDGASVGQSYIDALANAIGWNYNRVLDIGTVYRRHGIYFKGNTNTPYIVNDTGTNTVRIIAPAIHMSTDADIANTKAILTHSNSTTTVGSIGNATYIGHVDSSGNNLFKVDNATYKVTSTHIVPSHNAANIGEESNRWSYIYGNALDGKTLSISDSATINGPTSVTSTLSVSGATDLDNSLTVGGATTLASTLAVSSTSTFSDKVTVSKGGLEVSGATNLKNSLTVTNGATLNSTLQVKGNATLNDNLSVVKQATINTLVANTADVKDASGNYVQGTNTSSVVVVGTDSDANTFRGEVKQRKEADAQIVKDYKAADELLQKTIVGNETDTISNNTLKGVINYANDEINSIRNLLNALEDTDVITAYPSVTLSASAVKAWEVGTDVTPKYSITFNSGSYQYGPSSTECTAQSWYAKFNGVEKSTQTGTFDSVHVDDSTNLTLEVKCTYSDGAVPLSDLGREIPDSRIKSGTTEKKTATLTGFRQAFAGGITSKTTVLNSKNIRLLPAKGGNKKTFDVAITGDAVRVVVAFPDSWGSLTKALDVNDSSKNIVTSFQAFDTVDVSGATAGLDEIPYKLYVMDFASAYGGSGNTYKITIG